MSVKWAPGLNLKGNDNINEKKKEEVEDFLLQFSVQLSFNSLFNSSLNFLKFFFVSRYQDKKKNHFVRRFPIPPD